MPRDREVGPHDSSKSLRELPDSPHAALKTKLHEGGIAFIEDPNIVRGLDYYVRTAFEFTSELLGAQSALGGGGRYDGLSSRFGEAPFPAVGFALGMERLMMALEAKQLLPATKAGPLVYLAPLGDAAFDLLFRLGISLKRRGVWAEMSYDKSRGLKWLLKQADRVSARYALIVGDTELGQNQAILKNMKEGTQETIPLENFEEALIRRSQLAI